MIQDYDFEINLGEEKEKIITTEKIIGKLDALIISTNRECEIFIGFAEVQITLMDDINYAGTNYIALRTEAQNYKRERFNYQSKKWVLNNALVIRVRGATATNVQVTLRCEYGS